MLVFTPPRGLPKRQKMLSKTTCYTHAFSTRKRIPASILLPLGSPLGLPRRPQEAYKAS